MKKTLLLFFTFLLFSRISLIAQVLESNDEDTSYASLKEKIAELQGKVDGLNESFLETKSIVDSFRKIKISGYILAQFQSAQTDGATTIFEGGNYGKDLHNRFKLR